MPESPNTNPATDQAHLWRKLHYLTMGRINMIRAFEIILDEQPTGPFRESIQAIVATLREGQPLSDCLGRQPNVFSRSVREMILSAEGTGAWDVVLPILSTGLEDGTFT
ncbi:MAG: type II secretion system F family protein [Verrucomicrobia bacterium]|nr:type II secretion system F family protein [Verrucomicrobiota bacterium]